MYTPHFAAALTIKSRIRRAPTWALLLGAFLPDLVWIPLAHTVTGPWHTGSITSESAWAEFWALMPRERKAGTPTSVPAL